MAKKTKAKVQLEVNAKGGGFKKVAVESKKAGKGLGEVAKNSREADRNIKGAANASSGASKNFSKMSQGMGGLVGAYATLAANIFAISAAFRFLKDAADLRVMREGQLEYAQTTGESMALLTANVQEATGQMLNFTEAAQAVQIGRAAGLDSSQITDLAAVAKSASLALGRDLTDSFNRLTRGAIKAEPELLDELGIIVRLDQATSDYAQTVGKTAKDLTTWEKSQAVVNAVITQGQKKFKDYNVQLNQFTKMGKEFDDLLNSIKDMITPIAEFVAGGLNKNIAALAGAFALLGTGIIKSLTPAPAAIQDVEETLARSRERIGELSQTGKVPKGGLGGVERSAKGKSEKIFLNRNKAEVRKHIRIIRAIEERGLAERSTGWKRFWAMRKAELLEYQAHHGRMVGTIKAGLANLGRFASSALNFIGVLGILSIAISMGKQLIEMFKDPAIKAMQDAMEGISDTFASQNKHITELVQGLKDTNSSLEEVQQFANVMSNFNMQPFLGMAAALEKVKVDDLNLEVLGGESGFNENIKTGIELLQRQADLLESRGSSGAPAIRAHALEIERISQEVLTANAVALRMDADLQDRYDAISDRRAEGFGPAQAGPLEAGAVQDLELAFATAAQSAASLRAELQAVLGEAPAVVTSATAVLQSVPTGVERTERALENFNETQKQFIVQNSRFSSLGEAFTDVGEAYVNMIEGLGEVDTGATFDSILGEGTEAMIDRMLGDDALKRVQEVEAGMIEVNGVQIEATKLQAQALQISKEMKAVRDDILKIEETMLLNAQRLATARFKALAGQTRLQSEQLNREHEIFKLEHEINKIEQEQEIRRIARTTAEQVTIDLEESKLELYRAQIEELEKQEQLQIQIARAANQAFETATVSNLADLIKGKEKSISDAFLKIAESVLGKVADTISENLIQSLMGIKSPAAAFRDAAVTGATTVHTKTVEAFTEGARIVGDAIRRALGLGGGVGENEMVSPQTLSSADRLSALPEDMFMLKDPAPEEEKKGIWEKMFGKKIESPTLNSDGPQMFNAEAGQDQGNYGNTSSTRTASIFGPVISSFENLFAGEGPFLSRLGDFFSGDSSFLKGLGSMFGELGGIFGDLLGGAGNLLGMIPGLGFLGMADGGILKGGFRKYANGGIANSPTLGLIGEGRHNEAVVPLPNGKAIPVDMRSSAQNNNITVNVSSDGQTETEGGSDSDGLGRAIAAAVQEELQNQKRSGGILNRYGTA